MKRRRNAIVAIAAASIASSGGAAVAASSSVAGEHDDEPSAFSQPQSPPLRTRSQHQYYHHPNRRQLQQSAAAAFASFTPQKIKHATPLDLKIDDDLGIPYMATLNGYMKPYAAETFAAGYNNRDYDAIETKSATKRTGGSSSIKAGNDDRDIGDARYWNSIINLNSILEGKKDDGGGRRSSNNSHHLQSHHKVVSDADDHLYFKLLEIDGINGKDKSLRGERRTDDERRLEEKSSSSSSGASLFVASYQEHSKEDEEDQHKESSRMRLKRGSRNKTKDDNVKIEKTDNNEDKKSNRRKNKLPRIDRISPSNGEIIQDKQTFRARVQPSSTTDVPVRSVYFQLTDSSGSKSDVLTVPRVSDNLYEITVDGFSKYEGTEWSFTLIAEDERGKERKSDDISFQIAEGGGGGGGDSFVDDDNHSSTGEEKEENRFDEEEENADDGAGSGLMPQKKATDSSWTYRGAITGATGRILFEFDGSDETFVCSGTVIHDGDGGRTPDHDNGRSIIQTAAHCAYSDVMKRFASKAIFIPDQESTLGSESDFDCFNDKFGCWYLSFAVVADGWTRGSFPENVEYDYAYWVVYDDPWNTHSGGYAPGLTGQLDLDVKSMRVDFDSNILLDREFIFSIGYSADKDPNLRHCAMESSKINGVDWYDNLWLEDCTLTGGASGGPWMMDMHEDGVGTLISVNSWGFAYKPGMAGPNLSTSTGSWAECLYTQAKRANDPGGEGGYIMDNC
ncbi:hypothetical protein ACHAWU_004497 [Discostella pseudostelligera]|uniref:Uncharacterized protein n=1 Tax=Discostella pseudostelligera TaxID=259834 RepID=A0ABD3MSQ3_9STRA